MGTWSVDAKSEPGILRLKLQGMLTVAEMKAFVEAHNRAIDAYGTQDYKVWCDIAEMLPLAADGSALFEAAKRYSGEHKNFLGSAVLVSGATTAMQHRRTSVAGGVMATELISEDPAVLRAHLCTVNRRGA
jgi:hypothetical protein